MSAEPNPRVLSQQLRLACPQCGGRVFAFAEEESKHVTCPTCKARVEIPSAAEVLARVEAAPVTPSPAPAPPAEEFIAVVCRLCKTRMYARAEQAGEALRCPDCFTETLVKAPRERPAAAHTRTPIETYGVTMPEAPPRPAPDLIAMACPLCHARLHFAAEEVGTSVACPDCGRTFTVTRRKTIAKRSQPDLVEGKYEVGAAVETKVPEPRILKQHRVATAPPPESTAPPRWPFVGGMLLFPWRADARIRWAGFSFGLLVSLALLVVILGLYGSSTPGNIGGIAVAFPAMALLWVGLWTFTFGASCFLAVVEQTAAGGDEIVSWADIDWRQWIYPLLQLAMPLAVGAGVGYGVNVPIGGPAWLAVLLGVHVVSPILVLATLETGSVLNPFSGPVLLSLFHKGRWWLLYFVLATAVVGAATAGVWVLARWSPWAAVAGAAPLIAAVWFIVARLLGRLAWRIARGEKG